MSCFYGLPGIGWFLIPCGTWRSFEARVYFLHLKLILELFLISRLPAWVYNWLFNQVWYKLFQIVLLPGFGVKTVWARVVRF